MKQLKKASAGTTSEGNTAKGSQNQEENVVHISSSLQFQIENINGKIAANYLNTCSNQLPSNYLEDIFHPPKA